MFARKQRIHVQRLNYSPLSPLAILVLLFASCWPAPHPTSRHVERPSSLPIPGILAVTPPSGPGFGGIPVTILGRNFRPGLKVFFGREEAQVLQVVAGTVAVLTPVHVPGPASLRIVNDDQTYIEVEDGFTFTGSAPALPELSGTSLALGPEGGGETFRIRGRNFVLGVAVTVGGQPVSSLVFLHGGLMEVVAPAGTPGSADVRVQNPGGGSATLTGGYTYVSLGPNQTIVRGRVAYEKRLVLPAGLSGSVTETPIPFASVEIHVETDPLRIYTLESDRWGYFQQVVDSGPSARVRVNSMASVPPALLSVLVMDNVTDRVLYCIESASFPLVAQGVVRRDVVAPSGGTAGVAGAYNLLAVCALCAERVQNGLGAPLPALRVFWEPGNAVYIGTSAFYLDDLGAGVVPIIQILGGLPGGEEYTDTDEFDDGVVAHEFGHFVQRAVSTDSSPGGRHGGERLVPNLAFSEGFANWFSCACRKDPVYRDTVGWGEWGFNQVEFSCESVAWQLPLVKGIGSEETVMEMMWDLYDGTGGVEDLDGDVAAVGFVPLLESIAAFDPNHDYPCLYTLLDSVVALGHLSVAQVDVLSRAPEEQDVPYPPAPFETFPLPLPAGVARMGFVDARNAYHPPDPSWKFWLMSTRGNPYNPMNGINSRRYYRFTLASNAWVRLTLNIHGSGESPGNLDLFLLDVQNGLIDVSAGTTPVEAIQRALDPGSYIVEVRGFQTAGQGFVRVNAADFTLIRE